MSAYALREARRCALARGEFSSRRLIRALRAPALRASLRRALAFLLDFALFAGLVAPAPCDLPPEASAVRAPRSDTPPKATSASRRSHRRRFWCPACGFFPASVANPDRDARGGPALDCCASGTTILPLSISVCLASPTSRCLLIFSPAFREVQVICPNDRKNEESSTPRSSTGRTNSDPLLRAIGTRTGVSRSAARRLARHVSSGHARERGLKSTPESRPYVDRPSAISILGASGRAHLVAISI
jgi:hypothetical protein